MGSKSSDRNIGQLPVGARTLSALTLRASEPHGPSVQEDIAVVKRLRGQRQKRGDRVRRSTALLAALAVAAIIVSGTAARSSAAAAASQGDQSDAAFAASYAAKGVVNVSATTQRVSCYAPEVPYATALTAAGRRARARRPGSRPAASQRRTSPTNRCSSRTTPSPISVSTRRTRCT